MCACSDAEPLRIGSAGPEASPEGSREAGLESENTQCTALEAQIEELRIARDVLERSRRRYYDLFDAHPAGCLCVLPNGAIQEANAAAADLLGLAKPRLANRTIYRYIAPDHQGGFDAAFQSVLHGAPRRTVELETVDQEGEHAWVRMDIAPLRHAGSTTGCIIALTGMEEAHQAQAERDILADIVAHSGQAVVAHTPEGAVLTWNPAAEDLLGYTAAEAVGASCEGLFGEDPADTARAAERLRRGGHVLQREAEYRRKDGSTVGVSEAASPIYDRQGRFLGVARMMRDLTHERAGGQRREEARHREQHARRLESLSALAGGIAHDYNNLLAALLANLELAGLALQSGDSPREFIQEARDVTKQAADLTARLGALTGQDGHAREPICLPSVVREAVALIQSQYDSAIHIEEMNEDLPLHIAGDAGQVQRAVRHVLENAAESYESRGTIVVRIGRVHLDGVFLAERSLGQDLKPGPYAMLRIEDRGRGMDAPTLERAFDPFFSTKFAGRGLGLAAVAGTVRRLGGTVELSSTPGGGTVLSVYVPVAMPYPESSQWMKSDLSGLHVCVVDADPVACSLCRQFIAPLAASMQAAGSVEDLDLTPIASEQAVAVVLDAGIGREGLQAAQAWVSQSCPAARFGIVGYRHDPDLVGVLEATLPGGAILKPYSVERLAAFLSQGLKTG